MTLPRRSTLRFATLAGIALAGAVTWFAYDRRCFFLFDDFAFLGQARALSSLQILTGGLFGFYRPLAVLQVKIESWSFGWSAPWGYLAISQVWHLINATLIWTLMRRVGQPPLAAGIAGALFILSPWSTETVFWLSGRSDLMLTFGTLACLVSLGGLCTATTAVRRSLLAACCVGAAAVALLSKDNGVVVPVLCAVYLLAVPRTPWQAPRLAWLIVGLIGIEAVVYVAYREKVLPDLGGAYGTAGELFGGTRVLANALTYCRAVVTVPMPGLVPGHMPPLWLLLGLGTLFGTIVWAAVRSSPRVALLATLSFLATVLPVSWFALPIGSSAGGRLAYLPGVWITVMLGTGLASLLRPSGRLTGSARILFWEAASLALVLVGVVSVRHQALGWTQAAALSRASIEQFRTVAARHLDHVFIPNLPFWFREGPYVLKDYAFSYYFAGSPIPAVRATGMVLSSTNAGVRFAGWVDTVPSLTPRSGEAVLRLNLPVAGMPPPVVIHPSKITVFATFDAAHSSEGILFLVASDGLAWRIRVPDAGQFFVVEPSHGVGSARLRVAPRAGRVPADVVRSIEVRSTLDGSVLASADVRIKRQVAGDVRPPFGFVDLPREPVHLVARAPLVFQGWALDDFDLRRVFAEAVDAQGHRVTLGDARRDGVRPDVSAIFPDAQDLYRSAWALSVDPRRLSLLARPITVEFVAEDGDRHRTIIGRRTVR